jgi:hypothetical protein
MNAILPKLLAVLLAAVIATSCRSTQVPNQRITEAKTVDIATTFLSAQAWAESYHKQPLRVVDTRKSRDVYFKHTQWKTRRPGECLIRVSRDTGEPKRVPLR